jgi:hypothetical protein
MTMLGGKMVRVKAHYSVEIFYISKLDDNYVGTFYIPDIVTIRENPKNFSMLFKLEWVNKNTQELETISDEKILDEWGNYIYDSYSYLFNIPRMSFADKFKYWWSHLFKKGVKSG